MPAYKYTNELAAYTVARQAAVLAAAKLIKKILVNGTHADSPGSRFALPKVASLL